MGRAEQVMEMMKPGSDWASGDGDPGTSPSPTVFKGSSVEKPSALLGSPGAAERTRRVIPRKEREALVYSASYRSLTDCWFSVHHVSW